MSSQKNRQRVVQRARAERIRAAQLRAAQRRKRFIQAGAVAVCLALIAILVLTIGGGDDDETDVATDATTSTTTPAEPEALGSAAGKPCVAVDGTPPAGAPEVPVKVGPPPEKLVMEDLKAGTGAVVPPEATVTVNYVGVSCSTGKIFDESYGRGQPATFALAGVIPGWTQGIPGMKVGGTRLLGIPSALAYGPDGRPPDIAPDEPLWFVVEVLDAKPPAAG